MSSLIAPRVVLYFGFESATPSDLFLIGGFLLVVGYLLRFRGMLSLVNWTTPDRAGVSESKLTKIAGTTTLAISAVSFLAGIALFAGFPPSTVGSLYYEVAILLVIVQSIVIRVG